jgi:alpha-galactosidase
MTKLSVLWALGLVVAAAMVTSGTALANERDALRAWVNATLLQTPSPPLPSQPGLELRRQDYGEFHLRQSVWKTPLRIGGKQYEHGLGTHSVSEIVVRLPRAGKEFAADAGIDNNHDTAGKRGTVVFAVEIAGKEAFRSGVCRGGQPPLPVRVPLNGATEFILRVFDAGDGPSHDQSDWADAAVTLDDGRRVWLDEMPLRVPQAGLSKTLPFSFVYGGKPSAQLLPSWKQAQTSAGQDRRTITYTDPATGLEVTCELRQFADFPAADWVLRFRNTGPADTPLIENVRALDLRITVPQKSDVVLHHAHGSTCKETDFLPLDTPVEAGANIQLAPNGGRSSNGVFPFFNLEWSGGGMIAAIGWSGQWAMSLRRDTGRELALQAGQQTTRFKLRPGESVRTPRILMLLWLGNDRQRSHNLLRRLLLEHYVPRQNGEIIVPPVTQNTWFTFNSGNDVTESNQLDAIRAMAPLGVECYWLDAGWFEGGWPSGVGSWVPKAEAFPRGLKPLGDAAHQRGMKFVVWFEPERVHPASRIGKEHLEFVLRAGEGNGLFNLGDPKARAWLTDWLSKCIADWGIDVYRNDFNIDPLRFWQAADAPARQGIAEMRYVEGLYTLWDDLRRRHPGLTIDNCASGGRRIDLETISRSYPLWRSDTQCCQKPMPVWDQVQTAGLSLYVPLHSAGVWDFDRYPFRSVATAGVNLCMRTDKNFSAKAASRAVAEVKQLRPLWLGDYHPLTDINLDERQWCGWQFHRGDLGQGFAMLFRRAKSAYAAMDLGLRGIEPKADYEVTFADANKKQRMTGAALAKLRVEINSAPASALIIYRRIN